MLTKELGLQRRRVHLSSRSQGTTTAFIEWDYVASINNDFSFMFISFMFVLPSNPALLWDVSIKNDFLIFAKVHSKKVNF